MASVDQVKSTFLDLCPEAPRIHRLDNNQTTTVAGDSSARADLTRGPLRRHETTCHAQAAIEIASATLASAVDELRATSTCPGTLVPGTDNARAQIDLPPHSMRGMGRTLPNSIRPGVIYR